MLSYTWYLAAEQPAQPDTLLAIQCVLAALSIYLDMKYEDGRFSLTVFVPDQLDPSSSDILSKSLEGLLATAGPAAHGRPVKPPVNDMTLQQACRMQSEGVRVDDIAALIGVSRRTFYRKLKAAKQAGLDPAVPYSKWDQEADR